MPKAYSIGDKINNFTILSFGVKISGTRNGVARARTAFNCICGCGKFVTIFKGCNPKSCGCLNRIFKDQYKSKKIRSSWQSMKQRCLNPDHDNYKHYGAKGITICERWMSFKNFYDDTESTWKEGLTIDRHPNNRGNYEPTNFRWATMEEQQQNKPNTKLNPEIIKLIRTSGLLAKDICKTYDVHEETIRKIRKRIRWKNI